MRTNFQYDKICFIICARGDDRSRALRKDVVEAGEKAAAEQALHEKYEAGAINAEQELQEAVKKCETLEQSLTEKESELTRAHQAARDAQVETQGALLEIQEARTIAAGKAFSM